MNPQLSQMILKIDPTSGDHPKVPIELINKYLDGKNILNGKL